MRLESMALLRVRPSLTDRLASKHHDRLVKRLFAFRHQLQVEMEPEPWTALETSAALLLSDLCAAIGLTETERATVLGEAGILALSTELDSRRYSSPLTERQLTALCVAEKCGRVTLATFRACCPFWSDETLRLDLSDLVKRGLLVKNGNKRGTSYTLPTRSQ